MNTIPTALIIIAGLSVLLLGAVLITLWSLEPDKGYPVEKYGKIGLSNRESLVVLGVAWLAPTLLAVAGWMIF